MRLRDRFCLHVTTDPNLRQLARRLLPHHHEDLLQHVALVICEMPDEQVNRIEPYFNFWCVRTITNSAGRWGQVGKYAADPITDTAPDIADTEDEHPDITPLRHLYWYDRELLTLYAELGSTRAVSDRLGIPLTSIKRDIADAKQRARELLARTS